MATNFRIKRSAVANKRPTTTNLQLGELALNTYDGFLFAERDGVGLTTVANLTPWYENVGASSIYYLNSVGIGTTNPRELLDVSGKIYCDEIIVGGGTTSIIGVDVTTRNLLVTGLSTFSGLVDINGGGQANTFKVEDLTDNRVVIAGVGGELEDSANLTFNGTTLSSVNINVSSTLDVDGLAEIDDLNVSAASTFAGTSKFNGIIDANHQIVGLATNNIIPFLFNGWGDLPNPGTYHGAFAHVHSFGKAYFAHAGNWYEFVNKELNGTIGVGTERYNIGPTDITTLDVSGISTFGGNVDVNANIDVNGSSTLVGFTTLGNNLFVAGVSTFANNITGTNATFSGNVSIGGTLTYEDVTNIDSIGIITARSGIKVLAGGINVVGIATADALDAIEIKDDGTSITTGAISVIDFTGGNTITYNAGTRTVTVPVGSSTGGGKFAENATGIHTSKNVGIGTTTASDKLTILGDLKLDGRLKVTNLGLAGANGQFLKSTGVGVTWSTFPTVRTTGIATATAGQTSFPFTYNVGFLDVFVNGVKLQHSEFGATNGTSVTLTHGAFLGDQVEFISYNTTATGGGGGGGGGGISNVVEDTSPELGGNLNLNNKNITGTGNISITGDVTATNFSGNGSSLTNLNATNLTSGTIPNGRFPASLPAVSGANLTGINVFKTIAVSGQSDVVADSISDTVTFVAGSNMTLTTNAAGDSITFASSGGGGGGSNPGFSTSGGNFTINAGATTVIDTFNISAKTKLSEYTVHLENVNGNIQSQKVLVMNYGAGVGLTAYSSEYGIMFHPNQIADIGVAVNAGICSLTATTKTGITGITTFSLVRQDQS